MNAGQQFDQVAESWDEKPEQVGLDDGMEVLDFGCGTGLFSLPWAGRVKQLADLDPDGGLFHSSSEGIFHNGFDRAELRRMWELAGFRQVASTTATEVEKTGADGREHRFCIFLMGGQKA